MRGWQVLCLVSVLSGASLAAVESVLQFRDFWARPAGRAIPSAAYGVIVNNGVKADTLLEVTSAQAARVELHETVRDPQGRMQMRKVERIVIGGRDSVILRPGGLHIMLYDLQQVLRPGDTIELRLRFAQAGWQQIACPVGRSQQPRRRPTLPEHHH